MSATDNGHCPYLCYVSQQMAHLKIIMILPVFIKIMFVHIQVPQTPASLAQMSLAQRAEQAVLQERALESQNEQGHGGEPHTVTIVGSGAGGNGLGSGGTIQVRGLGQMAAGATLQLAQLAGGQVS